MGDQEAESQGGVDDVPHNTLAPGVVVGGHRVADLRSARIPLQGCQYQPTWQRSENLVAAFALTSKKGNKKNTPLGEKVARKNKIWAP